jgi:cellulose synthase/poly-beta-1,6-N-acetylglucosamine synthase-like glycosyltransferase
MIGVIVPAHNEQALLSTCLAALHAAARHADLAGETVRQVVVLDACNDFSGAIAHAYGVETLRA